mgnify:CR=1 FL=1
MQTISRDELKSKMDRNGDLAIVDVLSPEQYKEGHLPGAINVPVGEQFKHSIQQAVPDKGQAVVLYCANKECSASPKAAQQMDELGYERVYDYEAGKADWKNAGLPLTQ